MSPSQRSKRRISYTVYANLNPLSRLKARPEQNYFPAVAWIEFLSRYLQPVASKVCWSLLDLPCARFRCASFIMGSRGQKIMTQPISLIFRFLQNRTRVEIWLYDNPHTRLQGCIIGFDEYMNLVLDEAVEISEKNNSTTKLGRILLKGDTITMLTAAPR